MYLLCYSKSALSFGGGARDHRDIGSVLPICLNKEQMGWGSLTQDWKCEMRGADVYTGEEDRRGQAEDLSGTNCVVHWL